MLLEQVGHYNDLSQELRDELTNKINSFGKTVRYKFDISSPNPDPTKYNGPIIWPNLYTLDPAVFSINDPYETRKDKQKSKRIGIIDGVDEKNIPNKFRKIRVHGRKAGIMTFNPQDNPEDFATVMYLELHPKMDGGKFADKAKKKIFSRIDEKALATTQRKERTARLKAQTTAQSMSDKEVVQFADAMLWDSAQDMDVLRNNLELLADTDPVFFNDLVEGKNVEYMATVKQALDRQIISFDPAEWKVMWTSNQQPITVLSPAGPKNHVEKMAEFFQIGGDKAKSAYDKIKSLLK